MKANSFQVNKDLNAQVGSSKTKRYYLIALSLMLLGGMGSGSWSPSGASESNRVLLTAANLLAEAKPADDNKTKDSDDDDKDDKKAAKLKRKQEKQAAKDAEEAAAAAKAKKDEPKAAKKDDKAADKAAEKPAKKDEKPAEKAADKPVDKSKKEEKVVEKSKKDDKAAAETVKTKTVITDKKTDKSAPPAKVKEAGESDDSKKEAEAKSEAELKTEALPTYTADSALISVLKDLSRNLKESEEFTKIEDPAQKAIAELAQKALQKALDDPQLAPNRIVEKVGKENLMPPMGTEAWSSGELDLGDKVKAALSVVWAKRENGLVVVTVAGTADKKAPNGKKIGEFVVVLNARSSVENGFDIQSQQNVSFWLGKIASIAVESDCCAPPPPPPAEGEQAKPAKEVSSDDEAVKKKSLTALPVLLTSRRREYLATLMAVEKHNALVAAKLEEENAAKVAEAAKPEKKDDNKEESSKSEKVSDLPPGIEAKTMQEAYERALRAVAMKELMKMSPDGDKEKSKTSEEKDNTDKDKTDKDKDQDKVAAAKDAATKGAENGDSAAKSKEVAVSDGAKADAAKAAAKPAESVAQSSGATSSPASDKVAVVNTTPKYTDGQSPYAPSSSQPQVTPPVQSKSQVQQVQQPQPVQQQAPSQLPQTQQPPRPPQTIAVLPSNGSIINNGPDNVAAFRAVRQPSVGALMMVPERALAGQSMTISIFDAKRNPEASVELSLNGSTMITNIDGQVSFTIPEDATPGKSLNVALAARPEIAPTVIDILQPLIVPSEKQSPSIEAVTLTGPHNDTLIVNGHFFDGIAPNNRIMIDGAVQGRIAAASPVELRISLPANLQGGEHSIIVGCDGLNSNPGGFTTQAPPVVIAPAADRKKQKAPHY